MFFFKRFKTINTNDECLDKILSIFSNYENEIINGKCNLCLTVDFLMFFDDLNLNLNNDLVEETFKNKYQLKVDKLIESFKNVVLIKITGNLKESYKLKFDLKYFNNLKSLELENVYLDSVLNLNELIPQLTTLKLNRCLTNRTFEEFFLNFGDAWLSLHNLSICRATFNNNEFNFLPNSIQTLQLQWNQINQFNLNSSIRQNLTELDLSNNELKKIPKLNERESIYSSLKVLKLKANLIDSFKNIELFTQLECLDLSLNLICDINEISQYLTACKKLQILNLDDNPIQMINDLNILIFETFPALKKFNNHQCYTKKSIDKNSNVDLNVIDMFNDLDDKNSTLSRNDESISNSLKANAIKKRDRVAVILDRSNKTDDEQLDQDKLSSVSTANKGLSLGLETNYPDLKEIIAEQRKSLGKKLLSKPIEAANLVVPFTTPVDYGSYSIVGELHHNPNLEDISTQLDQINRSTNLNEIEDPFEKAQISVLGASPGEQSIKKEDCVILNLDDEKENNEPSTDKRKESINSLSPKEDNLWSNEDMEGDNIFLVNKLDSNSLIEDPEPIFILIKDSLIYEKDCATGKIFEVYDLNVIVNYKLENDSSISLIFDSKVKSKQKVTYNLDNQIEKFIKQFIDPFVSKNEAEKISQRFKYECLKCGSKNDEQTECNKCKSTALIESTNNSKSIIQSDKPINLSKSSFKEDFLNQVKIKLTNEQIINQPLIAVDKLEESEEKKILTNSNELIKNNDEMKETHEEIEEDNDGEIMNLLNLKSETYDLEQFTSIDHELKLHLDVKIFADNERLEHIFECDFSINDTSEMSHGRLVTTNTSLYLASFKYEDLNDTNTIIDIFTMPLNKIKNIKLSRDYFFHQCVWLTVEKMSGKKKKKKHLIETQTFFIILKDKKLVDLFCDYLENYLNKQEIKLKTYLNTYSLTEKPVKLDTEENIIFSQFIVSLITKNDLEISKSSRDDLLCLLFEKGCEIILARCEVIANELKFKKICRNDLSNLLAAKLESNCKQLHLYFSKDSNNSKIEWIIGAYSVNSMIKMVDLIRTIWQTFYKIELQIHLAK